MTLDIYGSTIFGMAIVFLESAGRHGLTRADAVNALVYATWKRERFDVSRVAGAPAPALWVGPSLDGVTLEVMTYVIAPDDVVIFHCMLVRDKFRRMMEGERR
ncbi:hypothetical protein WM014_08905 [Bifidobacterium mongoliense]|uniref:hypothetical protein n=2 Tax=Bifidobacterium mongoliense TaxID=518643 RepID=UPI0030EDDEF6